MTRKTPSGGNTLRRDLFNPGEIIRGQLNLQCAKILLHPVQALRSRDRHDMLTLGQQPGQRKLCWSAAFLRGHFPDQSDNLKILVEVLSLEPRIMTAVIIRRQVIEALDLTGQEAAAQRTVRNKSDTQFLDQRQDFILHLSAPQGVFCLQCSDGMNRVGAADELGEASDKPM